MSKIVIAVRELTQPVIEKEGFSLVDLEFIKEGKNWYLRFALDKPGGIDLDDCAYMSEKISVLLDEQPTDFIPQAYFLEVSSPGAERPLKTEQDLQAAIGKYVHLSFYQTLDGMKFVEGTLKAVTDEQVTVETKDKTRVVEKSIARTNIAKARLAIQF